jgi:TolB protein
VSLSNQINRIAYINHEGQLTTISPDGRDPRILTQAHRLFQFPAWSPNGAYLAAIGGDRLGVGVFIVTDQEGPKEPELLYYNATELPFYLYWSPDSRYISFLTSQPENGIGLHLASLIDQRSRLLTTGQPIFWDWTPDSRRLLVHSGAGPGARLAFIDLEQNDISQNIAQPGLFQSPGIASNDHYRAFADIDAYDNGQLVVEDVVKHEQITVPHEGAIAMSWRPNGDQLAYISPTQSVQRFYGPLHLLDMASKSVQTLVEVTVLAFFWSPNGQTIAYLTLLDAPIDDDPPSEAKGSHNGIYRSSSSTPAQLGPQESEAKLYLELWVVDIASGRQRKLITFEPSALFINQFLPFFDQYALSHRLWSPASDALVLPVRDGEVERIVVITIDGTPRYLSEGSMPTWSR